jgi:hypothetical protein
VEGHIIDEILRPNPRPRGTWWGGGRLTRGAHEADAS